MDDWLCRATEIPLGRSQLFPLHLTRTGLRVPLPHACMLTSKRAHWNARSYSQSGLSPVLVHHPSTHPHASGATLGCPHEVSLLHSYSPAHMQCLYLRPSILVASCHSFTNKSPSSSFPTNHTRRTKYLNEPCHTFQRVVTHLGVQIEVNISRCEGRRWWRG
jgi:hypothetical protein